MISPNTAVVADGKPGVESRQPKAGIPVQVFARLLGEPWSLTQQTGLSEARIASSSQGVCLRDQIVLKFRDMIGSANALVQQVRYDDRTGQRPFRILA